MKIYLYEKKKNQNHCILRSNDNNKEFYETFFFCFKKTGSPRNKGEFVNAFALHLKLTVKKASN